MNKGLRPSFFCKRKNFLTDITWHEREKTKVSTSFNGQIIFGLKSDLGLLKTLLSYIFFEKDQGKKLLTR